MGLLKNGIGPLWQLNDYPQASYSSQVIQYLIVVNRGESEAAIRLRIYIILKENVTDYKSISIYFPEGVFSTFCGLNNF